jgi:hypothetical protein
MIRPMSKPMLAAGLLAAMAAAWYWALLPPAPLVVSPRPVSSLPPARPLPDVPAVRLADLAAGAEPRPLPADRRNPFASPDRAAPATSVARAAAVGADAARLVSPGPPASPWPRVELIGVAESREGGGVLRTAIVSGPHGVYHARAGDLLEQVYRIERIGADGVDVRLLPEDRVLRLALRP